MCGAGNDEGGYALRMFGIGEAIEEAVGGGEDGEGEFRAVDEGGEFGVVALARFAEKDGLDFASGGKGFFDQADAFNANRPGLGGKSATQGHTEELQPAIVAGGQRSRGGFDGRGHFTWKRSRGMGGRGS